MEHKNSPYAEMMDMDYVKSDRRPHMSLHDRAAQFSPFAALTGYEEAIKETSRLTQSKMELDELEIEKLNNKILYLKSRLAERPYVTVDYFQPDLRKEGGEYVKVSGRVKKLDDYAKRMIFEEGHVVDITQISNIEMEGGDFYEGTDC